MGYGLKPRGTMVRLSTAIDDFSVMKTVQTGCSTTNALCRGSKQQTH